MPIFALLLLAAGANVAVLEGSDFGSVRVKALLGLARSHLPVPHHVPLLAKGEGALKDVDADGRGARVGVGRVGDKGGAEHLLGARVAVPKVVVVGLRVGNLLLCPLNPVETLGLFVAVTPPVVVRVPLGLIFFGTVSGDKSA